MILNCFEAKVILLKVLDKIILSLWSLVLLHGLLYSQAVPATCHTVALLYGLLIKFELCMYDWK